MSEIRLRNRDPVFDYLPVKDADGHLIGLLSSYAVVAASGGDDGARVGDHMDPLSEADLIGAGTPIVALISRIRQKPFLVVSDQEIIGLVAWSDLQKLPVRAALFALVTGFELTMYETIKRHFEKRVDWTEHLGKSRLCMAEKQYRDQGERGSDVDLLMCTQFCDKRDILIKSFDFAVGKEKLKRKFSAIEQVRNDVAHSSNYAMTFEQAEELRGTLADLGELRRLINSFAR
ncbi:MAG: CBS domain-containing protein [Acidobacteriia bacterium]|nr:CBS domain-containing protein [Terriglobia bacterium]